MKYFTNHMILITIAGLFFLIINVSNCQQLQTIAFTLSSGIREVTSQKTENFKIINNYIKTNKFKLFKSIGIKLGSSINEYGWHHPFPFISRNFHDDPGLGTGWLGIYIEGLSNNYMATIADAVFRRRQLNLEYDLYDGSGNVISTDKAKSNFNIASYIISEKIKFTKYTSESEFNVYVYAGLHYNIITSIDLDKQVTNLMSVYNANTFGLNSGAGLSFGKKIRVSCDFYWAPDFSRTYSTENGYYKNTEFGVVVGIGYNNF